MPNLVTLFAALVLNAVVCLPALAQTAGDSDGDGIPNAAEALIGTDPNTADTDGDGANDLADATPTFAPNPMAAGGTASPLVIAEALVENNYDPATKTAAPDHLEVLLKNPGGADLRDLSLYVSILDAVSGATESTYRPLSGVVVPAAGEVRLHFDDGVVPGHFRANPNSIYITSEAAKTFSVVVQPAGFAPVSTEFGKDAGGAEKAD